MIKDYAFLALLMFGSFTMLARNAASDEAPPAIRSALRSSDNRYGFEFSVSGTITSETGDAMPGVNVLEKGTTNGAVTDANGKYTLIATNGDAVLVFSFIGYTPQEVSIGNRAVIDLSMKPDLTTLQEVVVVGYGTQQKRDVTGATATVKSDEIVKRPIIRVEQALQ